jgi:2-alkenal reductase
MSLGVPLGAKSPYQAVQERAGNIVTNNHVISGTSEILVRLSSGDVMPADIVGTAPNYDLSRYPKRWR